MEKLDCYYAPILERVIGSIYPRSVIDGLPERIYVPLTSDNEAAQQVDLIIVGEGDSWTIREYSKTPCILLSIEPYTKVVFELKGGCPFENVLLLHTELEDGPWLSKRYACVEGSIFFPFGISSFAFRDTPFSAAALSRKRKRPTKRSKFCAYMAFSRGKLREDFFDALSNYKRVCALSRSNYNRNYPLVYLCAASFCILAYAGIAEVFVRLVGGFSPAHPLPSTLKGRLRWVGNWIRSYSKGLWTGKFRESLGELLFMYRSTHPFLHKPKQADIVHLWTDGARDKLEPYKFAIVFENRAMKGYVTEKLLNALLAGCIPIYWGAPDVSSFINPDCFLNVSDFASFDECIQHVKRIDTSDHLYEAMVTAPIVDPQRGPMSYTGWIPSVEAIDDNALRKQMQHDLDAFRESLLLRIS